MLVDIKYIIFHWIVISLHQTYDDFTSISIENNNNSDLADIYYNEFFFKEERIPEFMLSKPGDKVACKSNE